MAGVENLSVYISKQEFGAPIELREELAPVVERIANYLSDEMRIEYIMTQGKELFDSCLREFVAFRDEREIKDDYFLRYGLEKLLDEFR